MCALAARFLLRLQTMDQLHGFMELEVWQRSMDLVDLTFARTKFRNGLLMREQCRGATHLCDRVGAMLYRLHQSLDP